MQPGDAGPADEVRHQGGPPLLPVGTGIGYHGGAQGQDLRPARTFRFGEEHPAEVDPGEVEADRGECFGVFQFKSRFFFLLFILLLKIDWLQTEFDLRGAHAAGGDAGTGAYRGTNASSLRTTLSAARLSD